MQRLFKYAVAATVTAAQLATPAQAVIAPNISPRERSAETGADAAVRQIVHCVQRALPESEQQVGVIHARQAENQLSIMGVANDGVTVFEYSVSHGISLYTRQTPGVAGSVTTVEASLPVGHPLKGKEAMLNRSDATFAPMRPETRARIGGIAQCVGVDPNQVPGGLTI